MCLSCGVTFTIDLCDKPECYTAVVGTDIRDDLTTPHLPSHDMFKVRTAIQPFREFGSAHKAAMEALKMARKILEDGTVPDSSSADTKPDEKIATESAELQRRPATCAKCGVEVSRPCWYCIDCPGGFSTTSVPLCVD